MMIRLLIKVHSATPADFLHLSLILDYVGLNLDKDSMRTVYEKFGLEPGTQDFIGHAMALYLDDECVQLAILLFPLRDHYFVAISPNLLVTLMSESFFTPRRWLAMENLPTSILCTDLVNYLNHSLACPPSMVEHTCLTSRLMRSSLIKMENLLE